MKTTLEIPDALFREAKAAAARKGIPFRELVTEALADKLQPARNKDKPWMECVGQLHDLRAENARINKLIEKEFRRIEPEDRL